MGKKFSHKIQLDFPVKEAKKKVEKALEDSGFNGIRFMENTETFIAETSVSFWSWGENIFAKLNAEKEGTEVLFTSKCALATQIIDWGKNRKNAEKFIKQINAQGLT